MSRRTEDNFAKARSGDLIAERVGDELVVYDSSTSQAHCLSPLAAAVFTAADGSRSPQAIASVASAQLGDRFEVQHIEMALAELEDRGLVAVPVAAGISRRSFMQRSAAVGGAAFAGTLITSVVAPAYGMAASSGVIGNGFSGLSVMVLCGSTYYAMKWDVTVGGAPSSGNCGSGAKPGNCSWPPANLNANTTVASGCLAGTVATVNYDSQGNATSVTISVPTGCLVQYYEYKYGEGTTCPCICPNNFRSPNTVEGTYTIPICGECER